MVGMGFAGWHWLVGGREGVVAAVWLLAGLCSGVACGLVYSDYAARSNEYGLAARSGQDVVLVDVAELESFPEASSSGWRALVRCRGSGQRLVALFGLINPRLLPGEHFVLRGRTRVVDGPLNMYEFDYRAHLLARRVRGVVQVDTFALSGGFDHSPLTGAQRAVGRARLAVQDLIEGSGIPSDNAGILRAILLGEQGAVPSHLRARYSEVGAAHILAVSGLHLAIFVLGVYGLLGFLLRPVAGMFSGGGALKARLCLATLAGAGYMVFTGGPTSCVRAFIMVFGYALARVVDRDYDLWSWLGVSTLAIVSWRPSAVTEAGFQLSTLSVSAIALAAHFVGRSPALQRVRAVVATLPRVLELPAKYLLGGAIASLAASLATLPFVWWHFHTVPLASLPANLVAVPLVTFWVLPVAICAAVLSGLPFIAGTVLQLAAAGLFCLDSALELLGDTVSASRPPWPGWFVAGMLSASLFAVAFIPRPRVRILAAAMAAVCVILSAADRPGQPAARVHFFATGEGDAALVRLSCGKTVMTDGGRRELGRRVLLPHLAKEGGLRVDLLVLTHGHSDHWAGIADIADKVEIGQILVNGSPSSLRVAGIIAAKAKGSRPPPILPVRAGDKVKLCDAAMHVLWPVAPPGTERDENDGSLVLGIGLPGAGVLFAGDVEIAAPVRRAVLWWQSVRSAERAEGRRPILVLKAPHHGHRSEAYERLLGVLVPDAVVVSSDGRKDWKGWVRRRPHGDSQFPHLATTGQDGAITVEMGSKGQVFFDRFGRNLLE